MCFLRLLIAFMLFCAAAAELEDSTDQYESMHQVRALDNPLDFQCFTLSLERFEFVVTDYLGSIHVTTKNDYRKGHCLALAPDRKTRAFYPPLTALDPMMPFYIDTLYKGLAVFAGSNVVYSVDDPILSRKFYCMDLWMIGSNFIEYFERFHSDGETCWKLKEVTVECYNFRDMRQAWAQSVQDRLCLDEDGCFNIMEFYGDDLPYCAKYIATGQLKNASFGSWHHSFINYCELTDLLPEAKYANYDRLIVRESGRTEEQLKLMCEYFRFQLLVEEGKEGEISEIKTGKDDRSTCGKFYWNILYIAVIIIVYL